MKFFALICVWLAPCLFFFALPLEAGPAGQPQYLSNPAAVPAGLSATDWQSIRALYEAHRRAAIPAIDGSTAPRVSRQSLVQPERRAAFPAANDPLAQQAYLKAFNTDANDEFGLAVAISGDTVVVGAPSEDSNATGIDGDETDNSAADSGAAYVFVRNGTTWSQQAYLKASNTEAFDSFGNNLAISGDTVVVGALFESSDATGINGDQSDNHADEAGAAYVFVRNGNTWTQQAYLKASNTNARDHFSGSVAISGDTIVVAADGEDSNATGVDGDQDDNSADGSGAAYVFVRASGTWSQQAYLKASNTEADDEFGQSVSVSGSSVVVAAVGEDSHATGVNGDQSDNNASGSGAAYVFVRDGTTWTQQAYLKASNTDAGDNFGQSVAISDETVIVGAVQEASAATGVNGDESNNDAVEAGAAYVFVRHGATWSQQAYLKASNTDAEDAFGQSVAISGELAVVGAVLEASGVSGDQSDNSAFGSGAAYLYSRNGLTWSQQAYLKASHPGADDAFGRFVAISGQSVVAGAFSEDSNAIGIDGDEIDNSAPSAGAAYVFAFLPTPTPTTLGNISTRLQVETDDKVLIGGVIITGTQAKKVLLRAIGPSLPLSGSLADPFLELHDGGGAVIASNDNWKDAPNKQEIIDSTIAPANDLESAILATLDPGLYTAILRGVNNTTGVGLVEAYDLDRSVDSQLANISTRGFVQTGDDVMIGGFIILGDSAQKVIVRAIGPSLPVTGKLADPVLELHNPDGSILASNDNWRSTQETEIMETGLAPSDNLESAIVATLPPEAYTAIVRGKNNTSGVALVEAYRLEN